jgi:tetratricopeptide (TPR) repeat protein
VPSEDTQVLQEVPAASDSDVRAMHALRQQLDADPGNLSVAEKLGRAYIDFGRRIGDAHYVGYAEAALSPWLLRPDPPSSVLVQFATILQYRHQFADARTQLKRALDAEPRNSQAWLILATLDMVQGDYETARHDCSQLATGGYFLAIACGSSLRSYTGEAKQSLALLNQIDSGGRGLPPALTGWVEGLLAETDERLGDWTGAEAHYRKALELEPGDNFLLVSYADLLLDRNRAKAVLALLGDDPQSDTAFLRVALAKASLHSSDAPLYTWIMGARFAALAQRGSNYFGREEVRYALYLRHDPGAALRMAQSNWQVQRAPWDVRVLLEAALAAGKPEAAMPALDFLRSTSLQDPIIEPLARETRDALAKREAQTP